MSNSRKNNVIAVAAILTIGAIGGVSYTFYNHDQSVTQAAPTSTDSNTGDVPAKTIAAGKTLTGNIKTSQGDIQLQLDGTKAPQGVSVFKSLSDKKFFNNTSCHRLTTSEIYVLQCGDPRGDGTGGPDFSWGPIENAPQGDNYPAGTVAVARQSGNAYSQGSQFFLVYKDSKIPSDTAGGYTVIGKVTSGMDVLNKIAQAGTSDGSADGAPKDKVQIQSFTIN
ncbi:MAG: peptidylprolyl isomerase [Micrococcaceae bacterium]